VSEFPPSSTDPGSPDPRSTDPGAILDLGRRQRLGMVEAVWGEHKSANQIVAIARELLAAGETVLVTRVSPAKADAVLAGLDGLGGLDSDARHESGAPLDGLAGVSGYPVAGDGPVGWTGPQGSDAIQRPSLVYHPQAACLTSPLPASLSESPGESPGEGGAEPPAVLVLGGGSSDLTVASEALLALHCHGVTAQLLLDVGVAGLHRLLDRLDQLRSARVLIACAGMEGALPTVLAGLLPQPVIAVPVSVGYGVSAGGVAALHGMLASCAPGLTVVNIDNGYGAAMAALRILGGQA
jgi:NCAIR mutase (PurE)-related protein